MITEVYNLATNDAPQVYTCGPKEAVIAAYAQSLGDYCTWLYVKTYGHLVTFGHHSVACGDFVAAYRKEG